MQATATAFKPVLPPDVLEIVEQAEHQQGIAFVWLSGMPPLAVSECMKLLNESRVPSHVIGWLIGMTLFGGDPRQQLAAALGRRSFRDDVIPHVIFAFVAGVLRCGQTASPRLWTSIEMLVGRAIAMTGRQRSTTGEHAVAFTSASSSGSFAAVPAGDARDVRALAGNAMLAICEALPVALAAQQAVIRGCGLRLAQELGAPARAAIEAALQEARANQLPAAKLLGEALVALSGGEPPPVSADEAELLARLLAEWRATHDPGLERAIARVGVDLARVRGPITAKSFGELESAWHAVAAMRDPVDVSRLLELKFPSHWKRTLDRVQKLAELPPDPRIAIRLADVARTYSSRSSRPLHTAIGNVIADAPTAAALPGIDAVVSSHAEAYARARAAIATISVRPADPALLERAHVAGPDVDTLYAQHAENPGDLEARAVLADALQAAGDPRGELIMLQMAIADGTASTGAARRVAALLSAHADSWTGPLPAIDRGSRRFERGFLVACETAAENAAIARTQDRPEWRTLEELSLRAPDVELAPLLARLPLLRRLCADDRSLAQLAIAARTPITQLEVLFTRGTWRPPPALFPNLRVIGGCWFTDTWNVAAYRAQLGEAASAGIHAVVHTAFPRNHLASALTEARSGPPEVRFTLSRYRSGFDPLGWRLRVRRDRPVIDVAWTYHRWAESIVAELFEPLAAARVPAIRLHMPDMLRVHLDQLIREAPFGIAIEPGEPIDLIAAG